MNMETGTFFLNISWRDGENPTTLLGIPYKKLTSDTPTF